MGRLGLRTTVEPDPADCRAWLLRAGSVRVAAGRDTAGVRTGCDRARPYSDRAGFTLIELLVAVGIIATLVAILLPTLRGARDAARDARCLSNLRQFGLAWTAYTEANNKFPARGQFDWGGVDNYDRVVWQNGLSPNRPINPYIGSELNEKARAEVFVCPRDSGVHYFGDPSPARYSFAGESNAEDKDLTIFGQLGTSYRANDWIWMKAGARGMIPGTPNYGRTTGNSPAVVTDPARFVLVGDLGPFVVGRCARNLRAGVFGEWWHGVERCGFTFLDGHAAHHAMTPGVADTIEYTFYVAPHMQPRGSWVYASSAVGTPALPAN